MSQKKTSRLNILYGSTPTKPEMAVDEKGNVWYRGKKLPGFYAPPDWAGGPAMMDHEAVHEFCDKAKEKP